MKRTKVLNTRLVTFHTLAKAADFILSVVLISHPEKFVSSRCKYAAWSIV